MVLYIVNMHVVDTNLMKSGPLDSQRLKTSIMNAVMRRARSHRSNVSEPALPRGQRTI